MAVVEYIEDYEERTLRRTLFRHRTKPRISALFRAYGRAGQEFEDVLLSLSSDVLFENATGVTLALYGRLLGEPRNGLDDVLYMRLILARSAANQSQGTPDEMIRLLQSMAPGNATITHQNIYPASCQFTVITDAPPDPQYLVRVAAIMRAAKPAGVSLGGVWAVRTPLGFAANPGVLGYNLGKLAFTF